MKDDLDLKKYPLSNVSIVGDEEAICDACESENVRFDIQKLTFDYGIAPVVVRLTADVPIKICMDCGLATTCAAAEEIKQRAIEEHLRPKSSEEIKDIRAKTGLNRQAFSLITGIGEASLGRWESGANIPNQALGLYMELIAQPQNMEYLIGRFKCGSISNCGERQSRFRNINPHSETLAKRAREFSLQGIHGASI